MATQSAKSGEVIDLCPPGEAPAGAATTALVKTDSLHVSRVVLPAGREKPAHRVAGEVTVQCLGGRVALTVGGMARELVAGQMLYLAGGEPHSLRAVEDSFLLVTVLLHPQRSGHPPSP